MKYCKTVACAALTVLLAAADERQIPRKRSDGSYLLSNGWALSPAGRQVELGGLPLKLLRIPGSKYVLAGSSGYRDHFLAVVDLDTERVLQRVPIEEGWMGLAVSPAGDAVYASAGGQDKILVFRFSAGALEYSHDIPLSVRAFPAGLAVSSNGERLYVAANGDHTLKVIDPVKRRVINAIPVGVKPYTCALSRDERFAYVSNWGEDTVAVVGLRENNVFRTVRVREKPNDLALDKDGTRLFVANGNRNTVSVIDVRSLEVREEIDVALSPNSLPGSTPNALALTADGQTLYVANADNNSLAVVDVSRPGKSAPKGFIPTGWYPTAVLIDDTRSKLIVANGKGTASVSNAGLWSDRAESMRNPGYIAGILQGSLSFIDYPDAQTLPRYSVQVHRNSPMGRKAAKQHKPPFRLGGNSPIKYVFYIVKENRTYDQIFGDMKEGNGDPNYCLFPEKITPNHHALARNFGLFDNLYHDAEVSADGHHWVTGAYATDYVEKLWPAMYGGKGRTSRLSLHDDPAAFSAAGFIWDLCARAGISYRSYGEFARLSFSEPGTVRAATPSLEGHIHPNYYGSDGIQQMSDRKRLELWLQEFRQFEAKGEMPRFTILSLPGDHLLGTRPGVQTPRAMMAENDFVLGKMVEVLSQSRFWKQMAIFVVEDDTQGGPDHVDAHRAPALVISPYSKRNHVDSTMYSSSSVLRTMELILGLPPLTQYDAAATPMWAAFQAKPNFAPYRALVPEVDLDEKNLESSYGAQRSIELTLEVADTSDDNEYNEIIWKAMKGESSTLPPRRIATFVMPHR
jgi:YVTN family beta-propeller protein